MFLGRDFLHDGPVRDATELYGILQLLAGRSSRGAAQVAVAAGEFSRGGRPLGSSQKFSNKGQLVEQKHLSPCNRS